MKEEVIKQAKQAETAEESVNLLREALHHLILQELDRKGGFGYICFVGGTALRVLYQLDRYSEDLDFSLSYKKEKSSFSLASLMESVRKSLESFGFACQLKKLQTETNVHKGFLVFGEILHLTNKGFPKNQNLAIKLEVDINPPGGAREVASPITSPRLYKVRHYDLPSLFAGKLCAILCRQYTKGRDFYDFLWYVGRNTPVNLIHLNHALEQSRKEEVNLDLDKLKVMLTSRFEDVDFNHAKQDVSNFISDKSSLTLFERSFFLEAVNKIVPSSHDTSV